MTLTIGAIRSIKSRAICRDSLDLTPEVSIRSAAADAQASVFIIRGGDASIAMTWLGGTQGLREVLEEHGIVSAYIVLPLSASKEAERIYTELVERHINTYWAPDIFGLSPLNLSLRELGCVLLIALSETPLLDLHKWLKAAEDKILAALALAVFSSVMLVIAVLIKLDSLGPILFRQRRHGWEEEVIEVWRFRTMHVSDCQKDQVRRATRNDPRVTRLGRFLRRTNLDELP